MGFFDQEKYKDEWDILTSDTAFSEDNILISYPVGSIVAYSKTLNDFVFYAPDIPFNNVNQNDIISIGVVLELLSDLSYIVMYKGFLNSNRLSLDNLNLRDLCKTNDTSYTGSIILNDFNRYKNQYKNNIKYGLIKNTEMLLPSNRHMDIIVNNTSIIIENISKLIGDEKTEVFYNKLLHERIYCNIQGHVFIWKIPTDDNLEFYRKPGLVGGYFLPVMHIYLNKQQNKKKK